MIHDDDELFVGYLPTPPRTRRFALAVGASALVLVGLSAVAVAATMQSPGAGVVPFHGPVRLVGLYEAEPYGTVWVPGEDGSPSSVLVVRGGKFGAPREAASLDDRVVALEGGLVERDGRRMIELRGAPTASDELDAATIARLRARTTESLGDVVLRGEIVDSKCHLGRMRPGAGRTHRACAQLCIAGGIPPALVTRDDDGTETVYLLTDREGRAVGLDVLPFVAEPVEVRGALERVGDRLLLRIDPALVERL